MDLATIELNTQGVPVRHVACDTGGDTHGGAARRSIWPSRSIDAVAIVGPNTSSELLALASEVKARGVAVVSPAASASPIRDLPDDGLIWRTCGSDNLQAKVLATLVPAASTLDVVWVTDAIPTPTTCEKAFVRGVGATDATAIQFDLAERARRRWIQMDAPTTRC